MGKVYLMDCTLRDGGYVNDWRFGEDTIKGFCKKISQTGIEMCEIGFIKGEVYRPDRAVFPDTDSFKNIIQPKATTMKYVGMLDMNAPIPMERIKPYDGTSIDGIRVIFKKDKLDEAYEYCKYIQKLGYFVCVNFVGTDQYTDKEFLEGLAKFNKLDPFAVTIVDSFGLIKRKQFLRLVYLADNNLLPGTVLAYHAHNNLQQAFGNAESLVELNLQRDVLIDACVFGMGRGAGNLNLELFAEYMNENYDASYQIEPMLEIMDEYLNSIYKNKFWGYSLPLYLSATLGCHPNYAIYLAQKNTLTEKSFRELLRGIPDIDKASYSKDKAETYYRQYMDNYYDDRTTIKELTEVFTDKKMLVLAPGKTLSTHRDLIKELIDSNTIVISLNYDADYFDVDYVFSSNMRRYAQIDGKIKAKSIVTSNMRDAKQRDYVINYASYANKDEMIIDNSGLMLLHLLTDCGVKEVKLAGMDGYSDNQKADYVNRFMEYDFSKQASERNKLIMAELEKIQRRLNIDYVTPSKYNV